MTTEPVEIPMTDARNYPLPENYDKDIGETSFSNLGFKDNRQYNTSYNSQLTSNAGFSRINDSYKDQAGSTSMGIPPQAGISSTGGQLGNLSMGIPPPKSSPPKVFIPDLEIKTSINEANEKAIGEALLGTEWQQYTNMGKVKLSALVVVEGKNITIDDKMLTQIKKPGKFYAKSTLEGMYGKAFVNRIQDILNTPDEVKAQEEINVILEKINKSANRDQAKLSIIDTPKEDLVAIGIRESEINTLRNLWEGASKSVVRITDKYTRLQDENDKLHDEVNKLKFDRLKGDDSLKTENLIKELEDQIEVYEEIIKQEKDNLTMIRNEKIDAGNKIEEIGQEVILKSDKSIKEKIEAIFKLKGFTLAAVIAAVTMLFSTIGLAISNALKGSGRGGGGGGGGDKPNIPDKVKAGLKKFAEWLKYLAGKSAAALPGIIGSIVSFLIKTIGSVVGFAAEHLLILLFVVVSSIIYGLIEGVKKIGQGLESKTSIKKRSKPHN